MNKSQIIAAPYQQRYIDRIKADDVMEALKESTREFKHFLKKLPKKKIDYAYAEGKWTIRQMLQHIIDAERVFTYRALSFARKDATALPGFEESEWAAAAPAGNREWDDLIDEFRSVRKSTEWLFSSFSDEQLMQKGIASGNPINVLTLGFLCAGHLVHHIYVIKEKYLQE